MEDPVEYNSRGTKFHGREDLEEQNFHGISYSAELHLLSKSDIYVYPYIHMHESEAEVECKGEAVLLDSLPLRDSGVE
jgi:hypothetical protein